MKAKSCSYGNHIMKSCIQEYIAISLFNSHIAYLAHQSRVVGTFHVKVWNSMVTEISLLFCKSSHFILVEFCDDIVSLHNFFLHFISFQNLEILSYIQVHVHHPTLDMLVRFSMDDRPYLAYSIGEMIGWLCYIPDVLSAFLTQNIMSLTCNVSSC